jgi:hypothetical protein
MIRLTSAQEVWSSNLYAPTNPLNKSVEQISGIGIMNIMIVTGTERTHVIATG